LAFSRSPISHSIATLDTGTSSFFDHRDPKMVKWLSEAQRPT
jgi:2,5-diketo-D-gluconate reductase A